MVLSSFGAQMGTKKTFCIFSFCLIIYMYTVRGIFDVEVKTTLEIEDRLNSEQIEEQPELVIPPPSQRQVIKLTRNPELFKYILLWNPNSDPALKELAIGQEAFIKQKCLHKNCFITQYRDFFKDQKEFDAIVFNSKDIAKPNNDLPTARSAHQKFIFFSNTPAETVPLCDVKFNGYFNWTWTYKLDSDILWTYFNIFDLDGVKVGPDKDIIWPASMNPVGEVIRKQLIYKCRAAAILQSHCKNQTKDRLLEQIFLEFKKQKLKLTTFGSCGKTPCLHKNKDCLDWLKQYYYFYFAFEESISEDYVTDKLLQPLDYYAVPIVSGGANYSKFLPPGSFLDARQLSPERLAKEIKMLLKEPLRYLDYHRWRNHFEYKNNTNRYDICYLCKALNSEEKTKENAHHNFISWWNDKGLPCLQPVSSKP